MNDNELISWFKSQNKPYQNLIPQGSYSTYITRHEAGLLKPKTLVKFFERMGYIKIDGVWKKL
jgi:hypothetical protein